MAKSSKGYGHLPTWFWVTLYLMVGGIVYFIIYYFTVLQGAAPNGVAY